MNISRAFWSDATRRDFFAAAGVHLQQNLRQIFSSPTSEMPYFFASFNNGVVQTSS